MTVWTLGCIVFNDSCESLYHLASNFKNDFHKTLSGRNYSMLFCALQQISFFQFLLLFSSAISCCISAQTLPPATTCSYYSLRITASASRFIQKPTLLLLHHDLQKNPQSYKNRTLPHGAIAEHQPQRIPGLPKRRWSTADQYKYRWPHTVRRKSENLVRRNFFLHIDILWYFKRKFILADCVKLVPMRTHKMVADALTKSFPHQHSSLIDRSWLIMLFLLLASYIALGDKFWALRFQNYVAYSKKLLLSIIMIFPHLLICVGLPD